MDLQNYLSLHEERIYSKLYLAFIFYNVGVINKIKKNTYQIT